ncbi:hypothetical protein HCB18_07075 [Salinispora arenicola]|nr:hypothetical protein [Salinispora arenicola]NIL64237.1 hypothetical protein [Salinispora arenicola]
MAPFRDAHPEVTVDGDGFFQDVDEAGIQQIIDQTVDTLGSKRYLKSNQAADADDEKWCRRAAKLLHAADSRTEGHARPKVLWAIHQDVTGTARGGGDTKLYHFTVTDSKSQRTWHLYVDRRMNTVIELTPGRAVTVKVANA